MRTIHADRVLVLLFVLAIQRLDIRGATLGRRRLERIGVLPECFKRLQTERQAT
jgi:hypothetical protein